MDEHKEEIAALYALGLLEPREAHAFEQELNSDPELRKFVDDLLHHSTALAHAVPAKAAPAHLREKILGDVQTEESSPTPPNVVQFTNPLVWIPWAMAACLVLMCGWLAIDRTKLQVAIDELHTQNDVCQMQVAILDKMNSKTQLATVVWDSSTQIGMLKGDNMPRPAANEDYQLWAIDPQYPEPVNAGVIKVADDGTTNTRFQPTQPVSAKGKFAISIEEKGGVQKHKGPIVMMSKE